MVLNRTELCSLYLNGFSESKLESPPSTKREKCVGACIVCLCKGEGSQNHVGGSKLSAKIIFKIKQELPETFFLDC